MNQKNLREFGANFFRVRVRTVALAWPLSLLFHFHFLAKLYFEFDEINMIENWSSLSTGRPTFSFPCGMIPVYFLNTAYCTYPGTVDTMSNSREEVSGESFLTLRKCQEISARGHSRTRGTQVYLTLTHPNITSPWSPEPLLSVLYTNLGVN